LESIAILTVSVTVQIPLLKVATYVVGAVGETEKGFVLERTVPPETDQAKVQIGLVNPVCKVPMVDGLVALETTQSVEELVSNPIR